MSTQRDYYEILGVPRDADKADIKRAYRKLALKHHPDRNHEDGAEDRFKELSEAYAVLSDPEKRGLYDRFGHQGVDQRYTQEDIFRGADFGDMFGDLGRIFETFFGGGGFGGAGRSMKGQDLATHVEIDLEDVATSTKRELEITRRTRCRQCEGTGAARGSQSRPCGTCRGQGQVRQVQRHVFGQFVQVVACRDCGGQGTRVDDPCRTCRGDGRTPAEDTLTITIPAGVEDGMRLRIPSAGEAGPRGAPAGDLYVEVRIRPHERFERHGNNLHTVMPIRYAQAALGDDMTIQGLTGQELTLKIPAGSHHGTRLRLRNQGLPSIRGTGTGDLLVHLHITVPKKVPAEAEDYLRKFDEALGDHPPAGAARFLNRLFQKGKE